MDPGYDKFVSPKSRPTSNKGTPKASSGLSSHKNRISLPSNLDYLPSDSHGSQKLSPSAKAFPNSTSEMTTDMSNQKLSPKMAKTEHLYQHTNSTQSLSNMPSSTKSKHTPSAKEPIRPSLDRNIAPYSAYKPSHEPRIGLQTASSTKNLHSGIQNYFPATTKHSKPECPLYESEL